MKTITKISDTEFEISETTEVTNTISVNLDQLENEKILLTTDLIRQTTFTNARVIEIDEQIASLKLQGAKTHLEVEDERKRIEQEEADNIIAK